MERDVRGGVRESDVRAMIRKQVSDLTSQDLAISGVWEFALDEEGEDGQDEATVRPYLFEGPLDCEAGMFIVRARFVLADGTITTGYLTPPVQGDASLGTLQPVIITPSGQVMSGGESSHRLTGHGNG